MRNFLSKTAPVGNFGDFFENILKIAEYKKPSFMFLENVKHIKKIGDGIIFQHIISSQFNGDDSAMVVDIDDLFHFYRL